MSDMIERGLAWLAGQQKAQAAQTITYSRGSQSVAIQATLQFAKIVVSDRQGNTKVERPDLSCTFTAADLNFGSGAVEPQDGDVIEVTLPGGAADTKKYKAMPLRGEASWHYCDPYQLQVRVHANLIGT